MKRFRTDLLFLLGFMLLPLLLFGSVTLGGQTMLPVDNLYQWAPWSAYASEFGLTQPHNPLISDLIIQNYAWKQFVRETVFARDIPLWNPNLFAGVPFLAAGQHGAYYPFSALFLILPLAKAYGWYTVSQIWLAGALMYVYGRILNLRRSSAFIAGLVFQGGAYLVISAAVFPMISGAVVWLPLLLACIEKVIGSRYSVMSLRDRFAYSNQYSVNSEKSNSTTFWWIGLGAVALGFQILAGHIEFTIYTLLVMAVYAAWRLGVVWWQTRTTVHRSPITDYRLLKTAASLAVMVLLGLMLGAVQLVPLYELGQKNFREEATSYDEVVDFAFKPRRVLTLALPNFFGNPTHHSYTDVFSGEEVALSQNYYGEAKTNTEWGLKNYVEGAIYLGILPLFLAAIGVLGGWRRRKTYSNQTSAAAGLQTEPLRWHDEDTGHSQRDYKSKAPLGFFAMLSFFSLAFIFGTPLYAILYYGLPFVNQLHTPFRWVFPLSLAVAVLAAFGVDTLENWRLENIDAKGQRGKELKEKRKSFAPSNSLRSLRQKLFLLPAIGGFLLFVGLAVSWVAYGRFQPTIERIFLGLAGAPSAFADATAFYSYIFWQLLTLGLVLLGVAVVFWLSGRGGKRPYWIIAASLLIIVDVFLANRGFNASNDPALLDFKPEMVQWLEAQPGYWRLTSFAPNGDKPFNANSAWLFNLPDVRGYDSIIPKQYTEYMAAIEPQNELPFNRVQPIANWESLNSPLLDVLGVKYVVTSETIALPQYTQVWQGEGVQIYENTAVAPRAYTLPLEAAVTVDNALEALTTQYDPRRYVVMNVEDCKLCSERGPSGFESPVGSNYIEAKITSYSNREVVVETAVSEPSWLILNDSYFPGWKAWIRPLSDANAEEREVTISRVNGNFRGVWLGDNEPVQVRFRYSPTSFQLGALGSFMAGIILLFGAVVWGWQRFYKPDGGQSVTRSLAKNSLAPIALNLFNKFIDFGFAAFYLRVLGPAGSGSFQTAIVTAGIFDIVANFGLDILLIRDVASDRDKAPNYLLNTTVLRLGAAVMASLPVVAIIATTNLLDQTNALTQPEILATAFIMIGMIFSGMSKGVTGLFYVHEEAEVPNAMTTVTTILKVGFGVTALLLGFGFVGLAAVSILTNVITLSLLLAIALRRYTLRGPWQLNWDLQRQMLRAGFPLMLIHLLQTVFISIDSYLLRVLISDVVAGWYSSAYKWFNALQIVPSFFTLALFPIISRRIGESIDAARQMYAMSLKLMLLLALPVAAVTHFLAVPLVQLVAGEEFLPAGAIALQIVIWSIPLGWLNSVTNYVLISLGLESKQPRAFTVAVLFNIIANLIFIPRYSYVAAGVTTILSELVLLVLFDYYLRQRMPGINWLGLWGRPFLLTAVMFGGMWLGGQVHLVVGLLIGVIIYPAGLLLLGILGAEERKVLGNILPNAIARRLRLIE